MERSNNENENVAWTVYKNVCTVQATFSFLEGNKSFNVEFYSIDIIKIKIKNC